MSILTLEETKSFLKIDYEDEDILINGLIEAGEMYLYNATGVKFNSTNPLAKLYLQILIGDWYNDRGLYENKETSGKVKYTLKSIMTQLQLEEVI